MRLLRTQAAVRSYLRTFTELRNALHNEEAREAAGRTPPPPSADAEKLRHAIAGIAKLFPDPDKAKELLRKLRCTIAASMNGASPNSRSFVESCWLVMT